MPLCHSRSQLMNYCLRMFYTPLYSIVAELVLCHPLSGLCEFPARHSSFNFNRRCGHCRTPIWSLFIYIADFIFHICFCSLDTISYITCIYQFFTDSDQKACSATCRYFIAFMYTNICLLLFIQIGVKGNPQHMNRGLDCDVIVAEVSIKFTTMCRYLTEYSLYY